jgi:hypothetical protein
LIFSGLIVSLPFQIEVALYPSSQWIFSVSLRWTFNGYNGAYPIRKPKGILIGSYWLK